MKSKKNKKKQPILKESSEKNAETKREIKVGLIVGVVVAIITLIATKACDKINSTTSKNDEIDQKIDNLYTAITFKHGNPKDKLENLNSLRSEKLKIIQDIQKNVHSRAFVNLEKIVPKITNDSSIEDWDKTINAHMQLERQIHKDFSIAEAKAFWGSSLKIAQGIQVNPMEKTKMYLEKPALELAASASNIEINLENLEHKNVQGVVLKVKELKYVPSNYPVIPNSDGKTIFVPNVDSLDSLHFFENLKEKAVEKSELENEIKP